MKKTLKHLTLKERCHDTLKYILDLQTIYNDQDIMNGINVLQL